MAPNTSTLTENLVEAKEDVSAQKISYQVKNGNTEKLQLVWRNIILFLVLHCYAVYGIYLTFTSARFATFLWGALNSQLGGLGITAGAHRLWTHRSYKAKWPLKLILLVLDTLAFQDAVIDWARDHRVHHKFSETNADPHNAKRGFFFAHMGWLMCRKHPDVKTKGQSVDVSDLNEEPLLRFQKKYYLLVMPLICFVIPTAIPMYFWNETFKNAFVLNLLRYAVGLNTTWLVNSAAHLYGQRPYNKNINPAENLSVAIFAMGEGWHNYHHTFPWDYKTSELGNYSTNTTLAFINFMSKIGWAYDLKTVPEEIIKARVQKTGDGSHSLWGWGDKDQSIKEKESALILNKKDM